MTSRSFSSTRDGSGISKGQVIINGVVYNTVAVYNNPLEEKPLMSRDLKDKSGIYAWVNKVNNKAYVGSAKNLYIRTSKYLQPTY